MEIILVRHGKPGPLPAGRISGRQIGQWVAAYNEAGIDRSVPPPAPLRELACSCRCLVASGLRRSVESAAWLSSAHRVLLDADLREGVLPDSLGVPLRLRPGTWVVIARIAWWLHWCRPSETRRATRQRATRAAARLDGLAVTHGSVVVVGHGMLNRFVATELRKRGWRGPKILPRSYWGAARFERDASRVGSVESHTAGQV